MAWRLTGDMPLSEPIMIKFADACMCYLTSMTQASKKSETGIFKDKQVYTMAADALAAWIARSLASMILTMQDKPVIMFRMEKFN